MLVQLFELALLRYYRSKPQQGPVQVSGAARPAARDVAGPGGMRERTLRARYSTGGPAWVSTYPERPREFGRVCRVSDYVRGSGPRRGAWAKR